MALFCWGGGHNFFLNWKIDRLGEVVSSLDFTCSGNCKTWSVVCLGTATLILVIALSAVPFFLPSRVSLAAACPGRCPWVCLLAITA
jgi:hypothetical protein